MSTRYPDRLLNQQFWQAKRVFVTGHTGFKGGWLCLVLHRLGAELSGYALPPITSPSIFEICQLESVMARSVMADVCDYARLEEEMVRANPQVVLHLAAQPLVQESFRNPLETFSTNIMGTAHVLQAARRCSEVRSVVVVTSDKCYEPGNGERALNESDGLGGPDPYSASKGCAELLARTYLHSFWDEGRSGIGVASARAGRCLVW